MSKQKAAQKTKATTKSAEATAQRRRRFQQALKSQPRTTNDAPRIPRGGRTADQQQAASTNQATEATKPATGKKE